MKEIHRVVGTKREICLYFLLVDNVDQINNTKEILCIVCKYFGVLVHGDHAVSGLRGLLFVKFLK